MSDMMIKAEGLGKKYLIGHQTQKGRYETVRDVAVRNIKKSVRLAKDMLKGKTIILGDSIEEVWALRDISFEITRGEVIGVIGRNGAGKSTLLKVLSRITEPSAGRVTIQGRVASLLEVGTGFHPELTGRENIFLNGAILGMSRKEILNKFDEIVEFAEVDKFLDTPVKRYSSGMYVRLAFAVAAHLEPEILLVDEVLAVGDSAFQKKCLGKMGDVARGGRTVLFVSHNMNAIAQLCSKVIWIDNGELKKIGESQKIIAEYLSNASTRAGRVNLANRVSERQGDGSLRAIEIATLDASGNECSVFDWGDQIKIQATISTPKEQESIVAFSIRNQMGNILLHFTSTDSKQAFIVNQPSSMIDAKFDIFLNDGEYSILVWVGDKHNRLSDRVENSITFKVEAISLNHCFCAGAFRIHPDWEFN